MTLWSPSLLGEACTKPPFPSECPSQTSQTTPFRDILATTHTVRFQPGTQCWGLWECFQCRLSRSTWKEECVSPTSVCPPGLPSIHVLSQHTHLLAVSLSPVDIPWPQRNCSELLMSQEWNRSLRAVTATVVLIHGLKTTVTTKESWNCVTNRESA